MSRHGITQVFGLSKQKGKRKHNNTVQTTSFDFSLVLLYHQTIYLGENNYKFPILCESLCSVN